ncbi:hypothetical protein AURDEDRAFT_173491 [Auricularia subglabra TFB-10046 SS5]|nr:hypothetical protein AURDEDRAFT_173491 [Auricularia subglabra TFB-10046 SS5]
MSQKPADIGLVLGRINESYAHWRGELHAAAKELEPDARSALTLVLQGAWIERSAVAAPEAFIASRHAVVVLANALVRILDGLATAGDPKDDDAALKVYGESTSLLCDAFRTFVSAAMHLSRESGSAAPQPDPAASTTSPSAADASGNAPVPNPPALVLSPLPTVEEELILVDGEFPDIATARSQSKKRPRTDDDDTDERPQKVPRIDPHADKLLTTVELAKFEDIVNILTVMRQGLGDTYAKGAVWGRNFSLMLPLTQQQNRMLAVIMTFINRDKDLAARLIPEIQRTSAQLAQTTPSEINPLDTEYVSRLLERLSLALRPEASP